MRVDVAAYLWDQKKSRSRHSSQIKDRCVFDFNHIPDQPLIREEAKALIDGMVEFDVSGILSRDNLV